MSDHYTAEEYTPQIKRQKAHPRLCPTVVCPECNALVPETDNCIFCNAQLIRYRSSPDPAPFPKGKLYPWDE